MSLKNKKELRMLSHSSVPSPKRQMTVDDRLSAPASVLRPSERLEKDLTELNLSMTPKIQEGSFDREIKISKSQANINDP